MKSVPPFSRTLAAFGVELDEEKNKTIKREGEISTPRSVVKLLVIPANEESIVARETVAVVSHARAAARPLAGQAT